MKITKLIIPLLGLTTINNANKEQLSQIEKMPEISYEVSVNDNWDNYYYLTNTNATEIQNEVIQLNSQKNEAGEPRPISLPILTCLEILAHAEACWNDWNPVRAAACYAAGWALYLACLAASGA